MWLNNSECTDSITFSEEIAKAKKTWGKHVKVLWFAWQLVNTKGHFKKEKQLVAYVLIQAKQIVISNSGFIYVRIPKSLKASVCIKDICLNKKFGQLIS